MISVSSPVTAARDLLCKLIRGICYADLSDIDLISVVARNSLKLYLPLDRNTEGEYLISLLGSEFFTVYVESDLGAVGIYLDLGFIFHTVNVSSAGYINEGLLGPPSLIKVKAVLLYFSVKGYKSLVVHTGLAALVSRVSGKIEHIPQMCCPHKGTFIEEFEHILVVFALLFLGLIPSVRMRGVKVGHALAAVLGISEATVGITVVEIVNP